MDWNCAFTEERLSDYLDGKLSPAEAAAFSAHSAGCASCAQTVALVSGLVNRMHKMEMIEEPPHLVARILDATLGPRAQKAGWKGWFDWVPMLWQPRFAMGLATVAALLVVDFVHGWFDAGKAKESRPEPYERTSLGQPASTSYLRARRQIRERPARGLRDSVKASAGAGTAARQ